MIEWEDGAMGQDVSKEPAGGVFLREFGRAFTAGAETIARAMREFAKAGTSGADRD